MTKLIALDTSSSTTGVAIFENAVYQRSSSISTPKKSKGAESIKIMVQYIWSVLEEERPDIVVSETPSVTRNAHTQRMLIIIYATAYIWSLVHNSFFYCLRPTEWRKYCSDDEWREKIKKKKREELKQLAIEEIYKLFPEVSLESDDEAEAILIGLAYIQIFASHMACEEEY